jgi:hypothetical protein
MGKFWETMPNPHLRAIPSSRCTYWAVHKQTPGVTGGQLLPEEVIPCHCQPGMHMGRIDFFSFHKTPPVSGGGYWWLEIYKST